MAFGQLCAPALIYIVFSITQVTIDSLKGMHNVAFVKLFISILFTILLNHLCQRGLGIVSWVIVFIPFMLMSVIVGLLLLVLGLDPKTGKLRVDREEKEPEVPDARADAIRNYTMTRTKRDYMKRLGDLGYLGLDDKGTTSFPSSTEAARANNDVGGNLPYLRQHPKITIRWLVFAEEFTKAIEHHLNNYSWRWDNTLGGNVNKERAKEIFEKNKHVATKLYFMDFLHKQINERVLKGKQPIEEEAEAIKEFLLKLKMDNFQRGDSSTLGPIKHVDGYNYGSDVFHVEIFKRVRDSIFFDEGDDTDWINELIKKYKTRVKSYENNKLPVWEKTLNDLVYEKVSQHSTVRKFPNGLTTINSLWDNDLDEAKRRISDAIIDVLTYDLDWIEPGACGDSPELLKNCKAKVGKHCKPCVMGDVQITSGENRDLKFACPYGCDPDWSSSGDKENRMKLCDYCHLCGGTKVNNETKKFVPLSDFEKEQSCNPKGDNATTYNDAWERVKNYKEDKAENGEFELDELSKMKDSNGDAFMERMKKDFDEIYPNECGGKLCDGEDECKFPEPITLGYKVTTQAKNYSFSNWNNEGGGASAIIECDTGYKGDNPKISCEEAGGQIKFTGCTGESQTGASSQDNTGTGDN